MKIDTFKSECDIDYPMGDEPSDNKREREALHVAVEKNRMEMQRAWVNVESLNGALQSAKETHDKITGSIQDEADSV